MLCDEVGVGGRSRDELIGADVIGGEKAGAALGVRQVLRRLMERRLSLGGVILAQVEFGQTGARHDVLRIGGDGGLRLGLSSLRVSLFLQERGEDEMCRYVFVVERYRLAELVFAGGRGGGITALQESE